jgi:hypothetical protein
MGSRSTPNTSKELLINEPTTWDLVYTRIELNNPCRTVTDPHDALIQLFSRFPKAKEYVTLLADARHDEDAMEIDISYLRDHYKPCSKICHNSSGRLPKMQLSKMYSHKSIPI